MVHGDDGRESSNAETSSEAAHCELNPDIVAGDFDDDTDDVEEGRAGDGEATSEGISERGRAQASEESTDAADCETRPNRIDEKTYARRPTMAPERTAENSLFSPNLFLKSDISRKPEI